MVMNACDGVAAAILDHIPTMHWDILLEVVGQDM